MNKREKKIIYIAYKQFYNKEPIFSKENFMNLTVEIQSMAYILNEYGVSLGAYRFCYEYVDLNMPMSMEIQDIIVGWLIDSSDEFDDNSLEFNERENKLINILGSTIRNIIANSHNKIEELRKISNILYVKKYVRPSANDKEIMELEKCTDEDLKTVEELIEFIKKEQCKDNFDKSNIESIGEMIDEEMLTPYCIFMDESGNGKSLEITETSRKKLAKTLINKD